MSGESDDRLVERFLDPSLVKGGPGERDEEREAAITVERLGAMLCESAAAGASPAPNRLRDRVLAIARPETALDGFADRTALLLDWPVERARRLLREGTDPATGDWSAGPARDIRVNRLEAGGGHGRSTAALLWCGPGATFPEHRHRDAEWALILSGTARNSDGGEWHPGDLVYQEAGSVHSFTTPRDGAPLLVAVVVRDGFDFV